MNLLVLLVSISVSSYRRVFVSQNPPCDESQGYEQRPVNRALLCSQWIYPLAYSAISKPYGSY